MLLEKSLLFELPVYRIDEDKYYKEYQEKNQKLKNETGLDIGIHIEHFGEEWEYNEIIGFLKFYMSGTTQIRVEYYETSQQRKRKTQKKLFVKKSDSFCIRTIYPISNNKIIEVLKDCIQHCKKRLKKRYIKTDFFEDTYQYMDWKQLMKNLKNQEES